MTLMGSFSLKEKIREVINYRGTMCDETDRCVILMCFEIRNLKNFDSYKSKVSKICTLMGCFWPKYIIWRDRRDRIISNFTNRETFAYFMTTKCSWRYSHNVASLLAPSKIGLPLSFSLAKKRIYPDTQLKREPTTLFWKFPRCSLFPRWALL